MLLQYKTVYKEAKAEITEKKSRFIAAIVPVGSEEEAVQYIEQVKKLHWNARHHCYAYVLGERFEIQRYSDDGEPGGTAGKPMLDVLLGEELHNVLAVVTRYFGGTLLGTGGLVRAYSGAVREGLLASNIITKKYGCKLKITTDYSNLGKLQYILGQHEIQVLKTEYDDKAMLEVFVPQTEEAAMTKEMADKTNGQVEILRGQESYY